MTCKICGDASAFLFIKTVLGKYEVKYFRCSNCLFVQTEEPYWLDEAYASAITALDVGMVTRNLTLAPVVHALLSRYFRPDARFLDFGGGYGLFVRLMRDRGFDFIRQDKYCENLFAKHHDVDDLMEVPSFEVVTAFELFEHFQDPLSSISDILSHAKNVIFTTELLPAPELLSSWDYLAPEHGQHISFYHLKTLEAIARKFDLKVYSNERNIHVLTPRKVSRLEFRQLVRLKVASVYNALFSRRISLLEKDYNSLKKNIFGDKKGS